ncbi:MAG: alpha/beta hydrolase [Proteobacteria bacterium]|nr:alpha/beta hydrolase [Pseudomonadota bacterium]
MLEIGPVWGSNIKEHRQAVLDAYAPLLARADNSGIDVTRDIAYGSHPRQQLDLYRKGATTGLPVVAFVHGGAFVRGERDTTPHVYANVSQYFAHHGCLAANVEYRLAPESPYPGGGVDVALAVQWLEANVARFGGDPARIFVIGHSAGGTHVGTFAFDESTGHPVPKGVAGVVFISSRLRADVRPENPNAGAVMSYFGDDPAHLEVRSPMNHVERSSLPVMIAMAEFENPLLDVYCAELFHRISQSRRRAPPIVRLRNHNHTSIVAHFNSGEDILGREILEFIARH